MMNGDVIIVMMMVNEKLVVIIDADGCMNVLFIILLMEMEM